MESINSQECEQRNSISRKIAKSLAFMTFSNHIGTLTLYFSYTNMKIKHQGGDSAAGTQALPVEKIINAKVCREDNPKVSQICIC